MFEGQPKIIAAIEQAERRGARPQGVVEQLAWRFERIQQIIDVPAEEDELPSSDRRYGVRSHMQSIQTYAELHARNNGIPYASRLLIHYGAQSAGMPDYTTRLDAEM